jgi:AcrR family transcriptional regulator
VGVSGGRREWGGVAGVDRSSQGRRAGGLGVSLRVSRAPAAVISEFQLSRILAAALEEASVCGYEVTSVTAIVARAGVSRKTFYELFESRDGCFRAVFEDAVEQIACVVGPLYVDGLGSWPERVRDALGGLLAFLERDRRVGMFVLDYAIEGARKDPQSRAWLLGQLQSVVEDGRAQARSPHEVPALAAEFVVGGALAVLHARSRAGSRQLMGLVNQLVWMIVLPYLGPVAAAEELQRSMPEPVVRRAKAARGPLEGLGMRVTYRTARVLSAIAEKPGRSNVEIGSEVEVVDAGQISKLLGRLEGYGLIENRGAGHTHGAANAWHLTRRGREVDIAIRHQFAPNTPTPNTR